MAEGSARQRRRPTARGRLCLVSAPTPADIGGCLQEAGKPLVGRTVLMNEYYLPEQRTVTDGKGCYVFQRVQLGSRYNIIVPGWLP